MSYEVIVVGGGIGGLTTAALLAARGVNVCLFERASIAGGCAANFEHLGYTFEPTAGLYAGWGPSEIHERIFSELPVEPPEIRRVSPPYVVRLPDHVDVVVSDNADEFEHNLQQAFPECGEAAVRSYRDLALRQPAPGFLTDTSPRFRSFVDAQLQMFGQCSSAECDYATAAAILMFPRRGVHAIRGGAERLAGSLCAAIRSSGGTVKLDTTVLRLAYDSDGLPFGVDLLSGERVLATRAIVSNLTIWDTYGKLVGLSRTPADISAELKRTHSRGAYLMFLSIDESASARLSADHLLAVAESSRDSGETPEPAQFMFAAAPEWDRRAPDGKRSVTVWTQTDVEEWFTFHKDDSAHEQTDQRILEETWASLHAAMPELGAGVEVIETATPKDFYGRTRRRLGMVGHPSPSPRLGAPSDTIFPSVFMVGDTVSASSSLAGVSAAALSLAEKLAPR